MVGDRCQGCSKKLYGCALGLSRRKQLPFTEEASGSSIRQRRRRHRKGRQEGEPPDVAASVAFQEHVVDLGGLHVTLHDMGELLRELLVHLPSA